MLFPAGSSPDLSLPEVSAFPFYLRSLLIYQSSFSLLSRYGWRIPCMRLFLKHVPDCSFVSFMVLPFLRTPAQVNLPRNAFFFLLSRSRARYQENLSIFLFLQPADTPKPRIVHLRSSCQGVQKPPPLYLEFLFFPSQVLVWKIEDLIPTPPGKKEPFFLFWFECVIYSSGLFVSGGCVVLCFLF